VGTCFRRRVVAGGSTRRCTSPSRRTLLEHADASNHMIAPDPTSRTCQVGTVLWTDEALVADQRLGILPAQRSSSYVC
jgi:hypothetical protein